MYRKPHSRTDGILWVATALLLVMMPAGAISQEQAQPMEWSDEKLRAVARAYVKVAEIQQSYDPRISAAETTEDANALQREANGKIIETIEEEDNVTVNEYSEVVGAAQDNDEIRNRLLVQIDHVTEQENEKKKEGPRR